MTRGIATMAGTSIWTSTARTDPVEAAAEAGPAEAADATEHCPSPTVTNFDKEPENVLS
jgi:hypothetical protein